MECFLFLADRQHTATSTSSVITSNTSRASGTVITTASSWSDRGVAGSDGGAAAVVADVVDVVVDVVVTVVLLHHIRLGRGGGRETYIIYRKHRMLSQT